jgi:hypothetical protein
VFANETMPTRTEDKYQKIRQTGKEPDRQKMKKVYRDKGGMHAP